LGTIKYVPKTYRKKFLEPLKEPKLSYGVIHVICLLKKV
jgi:hypothetical protein